MNNCLICGENIPDNKQMCPICGTSEGDIFGKLLGRKANKQAYVQGYRDGKANADEIKLENQRLMRENIVLRAAAESKSRNDDMDGEYE